MKNQTILARAVRLGMVAGAMAPVMAVSMANAEEGMEDVERIQVTGSRIQRQDMETASPVTVIDSATIKAEGYTSVDQVLQSQPSMAGAAVGSTTNNGADGVAQVDLRGMGANRTLVLLNGRRMVNSGSGADSAVDLNTIPVAMIQRIEVLKDGASAVYGSDAIAGVVNIITKTDFEGFQFDVNGDITEESDGENIEISALYGTSTDSANYTVGFSYTDRGEVMQADRAWVPPGSSSFVPGGNLGGYVPNEDGTWKERDSGYDYTEDSYLQTPSTKYSVFANTTQELDNDMVFTADVLYTRRESSQQMAPQPADVMLDVCGEAGADPDRCITLTDEMLAAGITADDTGRVNYRRRMVEAGPRIYEQETDTIRASAGLSGVADINEGMDWDLSYTYGRNRADTRVKNSINAVKMEDSIYANQDDWFSGNPDDIAGYIDDISFVETNDGGNDQHIVAGVISGDLFEVDAGMVSFALGAEYRYESGYYNPDPVIVAGEGTAAQQDPTDGDYNVFSIYEEVAIPVTDSLTAEFALRYDEYNTFGGATTWKVGLTWEATDDLMLRSVVATGFRAPNVSELYGGNTGSYDYLIDPWGNAQDPQILVNRTSDEDLQAEESDSLTVGLVYAPSYVDGLSFTLDYWSFKIDNAIARMDVQAGLNACHDGDVSACETFNITPDGNLENLTSPLTNVGYQDTSGVDFNAHYNFEALGLDWRINNDLTYLIEFEQDGVDYTGTVGGMFGGYAEVKNNFTLTAAYDDFSVLYSARYIGSMDELNSGEKIDSITYHNVSGTYFFTDSVSATIGVRNLTNEEPPMVPNGNDAGTVPEVYETIGRTYFGGVSVRF
ncbi:MULTISPECIES: TonB-dependent siderophore receptor [Ferrimonas]|uniref:TonB-dependent receptor plug domain-containing protein n=1 Tax=Ferrimonas TaxID=44011 RepID=UPI00042557E2|nr:MULTISPECIES: TonB-dependent receptor [Ferrimonas]USD36424.1 TonB-dependent receptor [Ferrimonas sp. SCSIO 43195]